MDLSDFTPLLECPDRKSLHSQLENLSLRISKTKGELVTINLPPENGSSTQLDSSYLLGELDQIREAKTLERALYYTRRLLKGFTEVKTGTHNDLNMNRWKEYGDILTDSLWLIDKRDRSGSHTARYWGNFIPQIPNQLLRRYTKKGEWVLDLFCGLGTTLIESRRLGRNALGIELQENIVSEANRLLDQEPDPHGVFCRSHQGNSMECDLPALLAEHRVKHVQHLILHPPYFDIIQFSDDPGDLSNAGSVNDFLEMMKKVIKNGAAVLEKKKFMSIVIGDKYAGSEWVPLGFQVMQLAQELGFLLKSIVVKNFDQTAAKRSQQELWRYRALRGGFYIFKHEYIFIFQKK